jgi:hypothetical protein
VTSRKILGLAGSVASGAASAARHPVATAGFVVGLTKGATTAAVEAVRRGREGMPVPQQRSASEPGSGDAAAAPVGERTRFGGLNTEAAPPRMPGGGGVQVEHQPEPESRDVAHGDVPASAREVDSWAEEAAASEIDVETPVGTTGADVGFNPDTAEADLQQPDTEPLLDPATAKAIRSEAETLQKGADPEKG